MSLGLGGEATTRFESFARDRRIAARRLRAVATRLLDKLLVAVAGHRRRGRAEVFVTLEENVNPVGANGGEDLRRDEVASGRHRVERGEEPLGLDLSEILNVETAALCRCDGHLLVSHPDAACARILGVGLRSWAADRENNRQTKNNPKHSPLLAWRKGRLSGIRKLAPTGVRNNYRSV